MQRIENLIRTLALDAIQSSWNTSMEKGAIQVQKTRRDFKGDFTVVVFPLLRYSRLSPELTGETMGQFIIEKSDLISDYNVRVVVVSGNWTLLEATPGVRAEFRELRENRCSHIGPKSDDRIFIPQYQ